MLRWARSEGAQYVIIDHQPEPGATAVYAAPLPYVGWTFHPSRYDTSATTEIWKFPPASGLPLPTINSASAQP